MTTRARALRPEEWRLVWLRLDGVEAMWPEHLLPGSPELEKSMRHAWVWRADDRDGLLAVLVLHFDGGEPEAHLWTRPLAPLRELARLAVVAGRTFSSAGVAPRAYIPMERRAARWLAEIAGVLVEEPQNGQEEAEDAPHAGAPGACSAAPPACSGGESG